MAVKVIQHGDVKITLETTISLGGELARQALARKFLPAELAKDAPPEVVLYAQIVDNFILASVYTCKVAGVEVELAQWADDEEAFARKLEAYMALDLELANVWTEAVGDIVVAKEVAPAPTQKKRKPLKTQ